MSKIREVADVETAAAPAAKPRTATLILPPGIHDISMAEYLAIPALSSGVAHTLLTRSPAEAWFDSVFNPARVDTPSAESDIGTCAHALLLEGSTTKICVIQPEDYRSKPTKDNPEGNVPKGWTNDAIRAARDAARGNGLIPLLPWDMPPVRDMADAARRYLSTSVMPDVLASGKPEQTIIWYEGDVMMKARPDWLSEKTLLHYKTTKMSIRPEAFARTQANLGYDFSFGFYMRGLLAAAPEMDPEHVILAQRQDPPYVCKLFDLTAARLGVVERQVDRSIRIWTDCQRRGVFPAYSGEVFSIDLSSWELAKAEEDMLTDEELSAGIPA